MTYVRALQKCVSNSQAQIVIYAALDERDDIDCFEDVQNHTLLIEYGHARDVLLDEHVYHIHDWCVH